MSPFLLPYGRISFLIPLSTFVLFYILKLLLNLYFILGKADFLKLCDLILNCRFFVHIGLEYLFTFWTCFMLYKEYGYIASMRLNFLASQQRRAEQFTVGQLWISLHLWRTLCFLQYYLFSCTFGFLTVLCS